MKRKQSITVVLSVIYAFCIVYGHDIMNHDTVAYLSGKTWGRIIAWSVIMYLCTNLCRFLIPKILGGLDKRNIICWGISYFFPVMWAIILIGWIPVYLACYPGLGIYDGPCQLGEITTHHPLIHTLFIHGMNKLAQSTGLESWLIPYAIIQLGILSAVFAYLLSCLKSWGFHMVYICFVLAWIILFPMNPLMAVTTTKDTFFAASFILVICEIVKIIRGGGILRRRAIAAGL